MKRTGLFLALCLVAVEPALAQYGAVGLSPVRAQHFVADGFESASPDFWSTLVSQGSAERATHGARAFLP